MKLLDRRREAAAAFAHLRERERIWTSRTRVLRAWTSRHREGVIVGGGFLAGLATSLLPLATLVRVGSSFAGTVSLMLEGPLLRLLASHAQRDGTETTSPQATSADGLQ